MQTKILENRLRRSLKRRGRKLVKSKSRDPSAIGYGKYMITSPITVVAGDGFTLSLADVQRWMEEAATAT